MLDLAVFFLFSLCTYDFPPLKKGTKGDLSSTSLIPFVWTF
jgi:hypothetical protein